MGLQKKPLTVVSAHRGQMLLQRKMHSGECPPFKDKKDDSQREKAVVHSKSDVFS